MISLGHTKGWVGRAPVMMLVVLSAIVAAVLVFLLPPPWAVPKKDEGAPPPFRPASLDRPVPDFQLIDQEGKSVSLADLRGSYWVAGFIFTRCKGICPTVSAAMARLAEELPDDVKLVSFSVDPKYDTPEILAEYAARFGVKTADRWKFLTGDREAIYRVSKEGFLLVVEENSDPKADPGDLVTHTSRIVIVDDLGIARTTYNTLDASSMELVKSSIERLRQKKVSDERP
jgi:cytochrome oxidase Cu insertion factor (SCO1/SenC/PrrC family)